MFQQVLHFSVSFQSTVWYNFKIHIIRKGKGIEKLSSKLECLFMEECKAYNPLVLSLYSIHHGKITLSNV